MDTRKESNMICEILETACNQEIKWAQHSYGNNILGISNSSSEENVKYLTNQRLKALRLPAMWDGVKNPYLHLDVKSRGNFFETSGMTDYSQSGAVAGWDDF